MSCWRSWKRETIPHHLTGRVSEAAWGRELKQHGSFCKKSIFHLQNQALAVIMLKDVYHRIGGVIQIKV
jgi:hypothetical protein